MLSARPGHSLYNSALSTLSVTRWLRGRSCPCPSSLLLLAAAFLRSLPPSPLRSGYKLARLVGPNHCSTSLLLDLSSLPSSHHRRVRGFIVVAAAAMEESGVVSGGTVASWVASGVVLWSTAFVLLRALFPKRSYDFCNRAVSAMHAVTAVCLACLSVHDWSCPVCPLAAASSPSQMKALAVTLSYMVYDAACCHLNGDVRLDNTVHHLVSIVGIGAGLAYQRCGTEMVASQFITEISSPLLHLREILKEFGVRDTDLNLLVDVLFALTFSVARMGFGPYLTYATVTADNPILIKAMATGLQLVSAYWFLRILRMVRYKLGKNKKKKPPSAAPAGKLATD